MYSGEDFGEEDEDAEEQDWDEQGSLEMEGVEDGGVWKQKVGFGHEIRMIVGRHSPCIAVLFLTLVHAVVIVLTYHKYSILQRIELASIVICSGQCSSSHVADANQVERCRGHSRYVAGSGSMAEFNVQLRW